METGCLWRAYVQFACVSTAHVYGEQIHFRSVGDTENGASWHVQVANSDFGRRHAGVRLANRGSIDIGVLFWYFVCMFYFCVLEINMIYVADNEFQYSIYLQLSSMLQFDGFFLYCSGSNLSFEPAILKRLHTHLPIAHFTLARS